MSRQWLSDWRSSSGTAEARPILVGHSMGGIVSRDFLEVLEGWRDTRALITFGTPYRGSLNALDYLASGMRKGPAGIVDLSDLIRSLTSVYQLLPVYKCFDPGDGTLILVGEAGSIPGLDAAKAASAFPNSVVFNFACYSGGTPSHSDSNHWVPQFRLDNYVPDRAFVSALHRALLAHPAGPLAAVGHVEPAWAYGFTNPADPNDVVRDQALDVEWGQRMRPFKAFVERMTAGGTVGYAMEIFGYLYNELGNQIAGMINRYLRDRQANPELKDEVRRMAIRWISRNDYQHYVVFGDPAVRIA